jgi:hypothetical protein
MARPKIPPEPANSVVFEVGSLWEQSFDRVKKIYPQIAQKIQEFRDLKKNNPLDLFGSNDKPFVSDGVFKKQLPKGRKAHLTQDISIIYELSGRNPTNIKLYGVFTHSDMGTGQPINMNVQRNLAKRLATEEIELDQ